MSTADEILRKTPWEEIPFSFDLTDVLAAGETISSQTVTATPVGLTVASVDATGAVIQGTYSGGVAGVEYHVTCRVTTNLRKIESCGYLHVVDC